MCEIVCDHMVQRVFVDNFAALEYLVVRVGGCMHGECVIV